MQLDTMRAWWFHRQGLDRLRSVSSAETLSKTGWARSVGGCNPYLTLLARSGQSRVSVDTDIANIHIHELPSARGCTYVLPAEHFALGLAAGESFRKAEERVAAKLGVNESEIDRLCDSVLNALSDQALAPDEIRTLTGDASRSLGEAGKAKGLSSTLPIALGKLQSMGLIRRVPIDGRLDQQRYKYIAWRPSPKSEFCMDADEVFTELGRLYFKWTGLASLAEFQWFSGLGVGAAKKAVAPLNLITIEGTEERMLLPEDLDAFRAFQFPIEPTYRFVSSIDGISLLRRGTKTLLAESDVAHPVSTSKGLTSVGSLADLPSNAILDRGRLIGLWEYDPSTEELIWTTFVPRSDALTAAALEMETYIRDQLGDARSFSLDSPKSRAPLLAALRESAAAETY